MYSKTNSREFLKKIKNKIRNHANSEYSKTQGNITDLIVFWKITDDIAQIFVLFSNRPFCRGWKFHLSLSFFMKLLS